MNRRKIYKSLLSISTQLKSCHWDTRSLVNHHYGDVASEIDDKIDEFVESCQGKYGELMLKPGDEPIEIKIYSEELSVDMVSEMVTALNETLSSIRADLSLDRDDGDPSDLEDIINDIRNILNTLRFHLSLK